MKRLLLIALLLLAGCGSTTTNPVDEQGIGRFIYRYHDDEKHVTCWVSVVYNNGALACIPDSQLDNE